MSKAINDLKSILNKLSKTVQESIDRVTMQKVGDFAALLVVKRTRLGYGVEENLGEKKKFIKLNERYVKIRGKLDLDSSTSKKKSNLTRTGEMLNSIKAKYKAKGTIVISPTGSRNIKVAGYNAEEVFYRTTGYTKPARVFNRVSALEFQQILRYYRKTFGDLVKKSSKGSLIR